MHNQIYNLFLLTDTWTIDDLISRVGSVDRTAAIRAVMTWMDLGVLKEGADNQYVLLEVAQESFSSGSKHHPPKPRMFCIVVPKLWLLNAPCCLAQIIEESPAVLTVQQQQAEQMKVFWKVRYDLTPFRQSKVNVITSGSLLRECSQTWGH